MKRGLPLLVGLYVAGCAAMLRHSARRQDCDTVIEDGVRK